MPRRVKPGNPRVAVAYLRVSTDRQELGPEAQRAAIAAWAGREGVAVASWHEDRGVGGATPLAGRTGLLDALESLRATGAGVLVIAKRDRLARDATEAGLIGREVARIGGVIRAADGAGDAPGPEGALLRGILDVFAEYEREMIAGRIRAALRVKRARGELTGRAPWGFAAGAAGRLVPDPNEQRAIVRMLALRADGLSLRAIVRQLAREGHVTRGNRPLRLHRVHTLVRREQSQKDTP